MLHFIFPILDATHVRSYVLGNQPCNHTSWQSITACLQWCAYNVYAHKANSAGKCMLMCISQKALHDLHLHSDASRNTQFRDIKQTALTTFISLKYQYIQPPEMRLLFDITAVCVKYCTESLVMCSRKYPISCSQQHLDTGRLCPHRQICKVSIHAEQAICDD